MGFTINEEITTKLNYKEIALVAVACGAYQRLYKDKSNTATDMGKLVDRLGEELYNYKPVKPSLKERSDLIEQLEAFALFLEENGYMDTDWRSEEPYAIDEYLKTIKK